MQLRPEQHIAVPPPQIDPMPVQPQAVPSHVSVPLHVPPPLIDAAQQASAIPPQFAQT
jgi:hypothetical protein